MLPSRTCCLTEEGVAEGWGPWAATWRCTGAVAAKAEVPPPSEQLCGYVYTSSLHGGSCGQVAALCLHIGVISCETCRLAGGLQD